MINLTKKLPLLGMCCSKVENINAVDNNLEILIAEDGNLTMLNDEENYNTIQTELKKICGVKFNLNFKIAKKEVDKTSERIDLIKSLFDKEILKIQKK